MIHRGYLLSLKSHGYCWLGTFLSLWLAVAYLWLSLFFPLMCAPYRAAGHAGFDQITAFEHTVTPLSVVMAAPINWLTYVAPKMTDSPAWLIDPQTTVTGLALTFINILFRPLWAWLIWVRPLRTLALLLGEYIKPLYLTPPEQPPRLAFV